MARILDDAVPSIDLFPSLDPVFADVVLDYFDSGAGPIPGPYGSDNLNNFPVPVDLDIIVDSNTTAGSLSLPTGSFVTVSFSNVTVRNGLGNDIAVVELADNQEQAEVFVSSDNTNFVSLGIAEGGETSSFDLGSIGFTDAVSAVRIVGLDTGGGSPGFDVLNVQAIPSFFSVSPQFNLSALQPEWNSENRSLRYGFEIENTTAPIESIAQNVEVKLFYANDGEIINEISILATQIPQVEGNQVLYDLPVSAIPLALSDEELNANQIVTIIDPENRFSELDESDNREMIDYFFVRKIPQIMRNIGEEWDVAANFQVRWLNNEATIVESPLNQDAFNANPNTSSISIDWILQDSVDTDNRAQEAFDQLTDVDYLFSDAGRDVLAGKLNERLEDEPVGTVIEFGVEGTSAEALDSQQTQLSSVVTQPDSPFDLLDLISAPTAFDLTPIDPLLGALGDFSFYAIPIGEAEKVSNDEIRVTATGVGIYALDIFEFSGFQYLGYWDEPNEASRFPDIGGTPVFNSTYRDYREQTGLGEDFIIVSNVVEESLQLGGIELVSTAFTIEV